MHLLIFIGDIFTHELWRMSGLSGGIRYTLQLPEQAGGSACCEFTWQSPVLFAAHFKDHWKVAARLSIIFGTVRSCSARGWWRRTILSHFKCCLRTSRRSFGVVFKVSSNFSFFDRFFTVFSTLLLSAVIRLLCHHFFKTSRCFAYMKSQHARSFDCTVLTSPSATQNFTCALTCAVCVRVRA